MVAPMSPTDFIADLHRADLSVLASASGKLDLYAVQIALNADACGYREVPRHPDTDAMKARFETLTESERAALCDYVASLPH